ncbi:flagellar cap protein FliD N-terminal domain-containing protein, partial [Klebsiella pneumoniae]|uniref:flagellar cap protein FliD N-terminal domain-containing protein n=1 Tax=Klebsiella pneumoniae TaxID=573 RepID=UPI003CE9F898
RQSALNSQISAASRLMNLMSSLTSSLNTRLSQGDLAATPSIANSAVATVTAGTATGSGTSTLEVTALAKGQTLTSPTLGSSSATIGSG